MISAVCTSTVSAVTTALSHGDLRTRTTPATGGSMDWMTGRCVVGSGGPASMPDGRQTGGLMTTGGASSMPDLS